MKFKIMLSIVLFLGVGFLVAIYLKDEEVASPNELWSENELAIPSEYTDIPSKASIEEYQKIRDSLVVEVEKGMRKGKTVPKELITKLRYVEKVLLDNQSQFWSYYADRNNQRIEKKLKRNKNKNDSQAH